MPVTAGALYLGYPVPESLAYGALELIGGTLLSPDLDGPCMWEPYWLHAFYFYKKWVKHRSPISHCPGVGILGRLLYLGALAWLISTAAALALQLIQQQPLDFPAAALALDSFLGDYCPTLTRSQLIAGFVSLTIGEALHTLADFISSSVKRVGWYEGAHHR